MNEYLYTNERTAMQIDEQTDGKRQPEIFDIILNLDVAIRLTCIETRANNIIRTDILHRFHTPWKIIYTNKRTDLQINSK